MDLFAQSWRRLSQPRQKTLFKIFSLALGLAFGFVMLSEVLYYYSFNSSLPHAGRTYIVEVVGKHSNETKEYKTQNTCGGVAPALLAEVAGVESATRLRFFTYDQPFLDEEKKEIKANAWLADKYCFDVIGSPILQGDPHEVLDKPLYCFISDKIAQSLGGGDVIGRRLSWEGKPGVWLTVGGVFKALPPNSTMRHDMIISLASESLLYSNAIQDYWGFQKGEVFTTFVRLAPGVDPISLEKDFSALSEKHLEMDELRSKGGTYEIKLRAITQIMVNYDNVKRMIPIMSILAWAILLLSLMNFLLLVVGTALNRSKSMIVHKCYGAGRRDLMKMSLVDSFIMLVGAFLIALFIVLALRPFLESLLGHKLIDMLNPVVIAPLGLLLVLILLLIAWIPSLLYNRLSIIDSFRRIRSGGRKWKLMLLSIQLFCSAMMLTMLYAVQIQYSTMEGTSLGYQTSGNYYITTFNMSASTQRGVAERIRQIPGVQGTAFMFNLPSWMLSSNHVLDEEGKAVFTFADFASADTRFSRLLDLKFLEGGGFTPNSTSSDVIISKRFAEQLHLHKIIKGGSIVGSSFRITGRSEGNNVVRVQGVYEDMTLNSLDQNDLRPQLISFYPDYGNVILISIGANTQKVRTAIMEILKKEFGADKVALESMEDDRFIALYAVRSFRDGIVMGSIIALLIALIGILGYVSNEINRRRKELAIRKINGAGVTDILRLFILDISKISIPAVIIGLLAAYFLNDLWQMGFAVHAPLKVVDLFLCLLAILLLIFVTVIIDCIRIARESPIKSIQNE